MNVGGANTTWCSECQVHKFYCTCNSEVNIYTVDYRLVIDREMFDVWCEEKVRCIAHDAEQAARLVREWALITEHIWCVEGGETVNKTIPIGDRSVTINSVGQYVANVREMLKACPLPVIFAYEE